jgi:hypothetical protein
MLRLRTEELGFGSAPPGGWVSLHPRLTSEYPVSAGSSNGSDASPAQLRRSRGTKHAYFSDFAVVKRQRYRVLQGGFVPSLSLTSRARCSSVHTACLLRLTYMTYMNIHP